MLTPSLRRLAALLLSQGSNMTKHNHQVNTIIVGGGHAGVNLACMLELEKKDEDYLVLERDDSLLVKWRKFRWEGFNLNTPVKFGLLYGQEDERMENDQKWLLERPLEGELERWDKHIAKLRVKHKLHSNMLKVTTMDGSFLTTVQETNPENGEKSTITYQSKNVVVCNGYYDQPTRPKKLAESIPSDCNIKQHLPAGFKFNDLVDGNILLVGSGQTGVQIADLILHHRPDSKLYMCTSAVPGCPRGFQGRDLFDWLDEMTFLTLPRSWLDGLPPEQFEPKRYGKAPVTGPTKEIIAPSRCMVVGLNSSVTWIRSRPKPMEVVALCASFISRTPVRQI
jgi:putative flavoprotein involved in K+ transport